MVLSKPVEVAGDNYRGYAATPQLVPDTPQDSRVVQTDRRRHNASIASVSRNPMLNARQRPATYADIEALPAGMVGEIVHGVLHAHPRPAPRHAVAAMAFGAEMTGRFQFGRGGPGGWLFMAGPELHLGPHVVVPDLAGWRRVRLTPFPETAHVAVPPDWVSEVLSPSTQALDRTEKLGIYAEFGVGHAWYADPLARTLEVFASSGGKWTIAATFRDADAVAARPFEVHTSALDALWVDPP